MPIKTKHKAYSQTDDVIVSATCDGCTAELTLPYYLIDKPIRMSWSSMEVEKGLYLTVSGGYSAYYDGPNIDILFCETCSKKLIETFPAIGDRINASGLA